MIRTLDANDFIEQKIKKDAHINIVYSPDTHTFQDNSLQQATELQRHRELFGIQGVLLQKEKGVILYHEGMDADSFYLLQQGRIFQKHYNSKEDIIVDEVKPSEFFGVESFFSGKRLTTAIVDYDAEIYEFKKSDVLNSGNFTKNNGLFKIVEHVYTRERLKLLFCKIPMFNRMDSDDKKIILDNITVIPFLKGQIIDLKPEEGLYMVSEGKMSLVREDISNSADSVYKCGDIIYKPLFKLAGEEDGEMLRLNEKFVQRMVEISEPFKGKINEEMKKRERYAKSAGIKQKNIEPAAHVMLEKEQKPAAVTENKSDIKKEEKRERLNTHEIRLLLSASPVFGSIGLKERTKIAKCAELACFDKNQEIIKAGAYCEGKFYIIKKGQVKILRASSRGNIITAGWLEEGDFFGEMPLIYNVESSESIISITNIELLAINKGDFKDLYDYHPSFKTAIINRQKERTRGFSEIENNLKALSIMNFMVENGLTYAANLKVYELNKCINCFSCVKACKERHGTARFRRIGPKYSYASVPQSCRTCKHPTCLSKCRKDAIKREDNGEIAINSKCVGCGLCAKSCAFGAIEVIEAEIVNGKAKRKSVKCEHCRGYRDCACVSECPTGAMKHVDPRTYFKHLLTQQEVK